VETWLAGRKVLLKVTVAPEVRANAEAIPDRVHSALASGGFRLASDGAAPAHPISGSRARGRAGGARRRLELTRPLSAAIQATGDPGRGVRAGTPRRAAPG
jgi:hypothetical protein